MGYLKDSLEKLKKIMILAAGTLVITSCASVKVENLVFVAPDNINNSLSVMQNQLHTAAENEKRIYEDLNDAGILSDIMYELICSQIDIKVNGINNTIDEQKKYFTEENNAGNLMAGVELLFEKAGGKYLYVRSKNTDNPGSFEYSDMVGFMYATKSSQMAGQGLKTGFGIKARVTAANKTTDIDVDLRGVDIMDSTSPINVEAFGIEEEVTVGATGVIGLLGIGSRRTWDYFGTLGGDGYGNYDGYYQDYSLDFADVGVVKTDNGSTLQSLEDMGDTLGDTKVKILYGGEIGSDGEFEDGKVTSNETFKEALTAANNLYKSIGSSEESANRSIVNGYFEESDISIKKLTTMNQAAIDVYNDWVQKGGLKELVTLKYINSKGDAVNLGSSEPTDLQVTSDGSVEFGLRYWGLNTEVVDDLIKDIEKVVQDDIDTGNEGDVRTNKLLVLKNGSGKDTTYEVYLAVYPIHTISDLVIIGDGESRKVAGYTGRDSMSRMWLNVFDGSIYNDISIQEDSKWAVDSLDKAVNDKNFEDVNDSIDSRFTETNGDREWDADGELLYLLDELKLQKVVTKEVFLEDDNESPVGAPISMLKQNTKYELWQGQRSSTLDDTVSKELGSFVIGEKPSNIVEKEDYYSKYVETLDIGGIYVPRIVLRDYLEFTYVTDTQSGEAKVGVYGRMIRFADGIYNGNGVSTRSIIASYTDELSFKRNLFVSDFCDMVTLMTDRENRFLGMNESPNDLAIMTEGREAPESDDATLGAAASTIRNIFGGIYGVPSLELVAGIGHLSNTQVYPFEYRLSEDLKNVVETSFWQVGNQGSSYIWAYLSMCDYYIPRLYPVMNTFPGRFTDEKGIQSLTDTPLYYGYMVKKDYSSSGLVDWLSSDKFNEWSEYVSSLGLDSNVADGVEGIKDLIKGVVEFRKTIDEGSLPIDVAAIAKIQQNLNKSRDNAIVKFLLTIFQFVGFVLCLFSITIPILWVADTHVDMGKGFVETLSFGRWVSVKDKADIPEADTEERQYVDFFGMLKKAVVLAAMGIVIWRIDIIRLVLALLGTFGWVAEFFDAVISGVRNAT
jgi:hypothetical protein